MKFTVLVLKQGKVVPFEGAEMSDAERIKEVEENGYWTRQNQGKRDKE